MVDPFSPLPSPQPALPRPRGATSSRCAVGLTALLTAVLTLFTGSPVLAGLSGDLDPTFSTNGWHVFDWNASTGPSYGRDLAVQADGKSVVVGSFNESGDKGGIARLTTTGTLDTTFSGDGLATLTSGGCEVELNAVAIQSSGRILVGGRCGDYFLIARYTTAGVLDTTFAPGTGHRGRRVNHRPGLAGPGKRHRDQSKHRPDRVDRIGKPILDQRFFSNSGHGRQWKSR